MHTRLPIVLAGTLLSSSIAATARAQPAPTASTAPASDDALAAAARELNRYGVQLLDAGDTERALEYFLKARATRPNTKNTANAAICLERMGRYDEALELYEELLLKYASGLDEDDKRNVAPAMSDLRAKVGSLGVSSDVGGTVVVDGKPRGTLPRAAPLRVLAGKHLVRVHKSGYRTFEKSVEVVVGQTAAVDARLQPLRGVGQLLVEASSGAGAKVLVDGLELGTTPWEGQLEPGQHVVQTVRGDRGSAPSAVTIVAGQAALARLEDKALGPEVKIKVEPRTARLELDGTPLGVSAWQGRLPVGRHVAEGEEAGYHARSATVEVPPTGAPLDVGLALPVDASHPRWPKIEGHPYLDAFGGFAAGASLGSDAEAACPARCSNDAAVVGGIVGARVGYRFPIGLSVEAGGGYLSVGTSVERRTSSTSGEGDAVRVSYELVDEINVRGPYAAIGAGYRIPFAKRFFASTRVDVGLLFASTRDPLTGTARTTGAAVPVVVEHRSDSVHSAAVFVLPEVGAGVTVGGLQIGAALGVAVFATEGPTLSRGRVAPSQDGASDPSDPNAVQNARESDVVSKERAYGRFALLVPQVSIGRTF